MKKIFYSFAFLFVFLSNVEGQLDQVFERRGSDIYFELLGNAGAYSINYETRFSNQNRGLGGRIGLAFGKTDGDTRLAIPLMLNYLLGKPEGRHFLEIGAGATYISLEGATFSVNDEEIIFNDKIYGTLSIMYHNHPPFGGFMWKIGFTPFIGDFENRNGFLEWFGIGLGYAF